MHKAHKVFEAHKAPLLPVRQDHKVQPVLQAQLVHPDHKALPVLKVRKVHKALPVRKAHKVHPRKALKAHLVVLVQLVQLVHKAVSVLLVE